MALFNVVEVEELWYRFLNQGFISRAGCGIVAGNGACPTGINFTFIYLDGLGDIFCTEDTSEFLNKICEGELFGLGKMSNIELFALHVTVEILIKFDAKGRIYIREWGSAMKAFANKLSGLDLAMEWFPMVLGV